MVVDGALVIGSKVKQRHEKLKKGNDSSLAQKIRRLLRLTHSLHKDLLSQNPPTTKGVKVGYQTIFRGKLHEIRKLIRCNKLP